MGKEDGGYAAVLPAIRAFIFFFHCRSEILLWTGRHCGFLLCALPAGSELQEGFGRAYAAITQNKEFSLLHFFYGHMQPLRANRSAAGFKMMPAAIRKGMGAWKWR